MRRTAPIHDSERHLRSRETEGFIFALEDPRQVTSVSSLSPELSIAVSVPAGTIPGSRYAPVCGIPYAVDARLDTGQGSVTAAGQEYAASWSVDAVGGTQAFTLSVRCPLALAALRLHAAVQRELRAPAADLARAGWGARGGSLCHARRIW